RGPGPRSSPEALGPTTHPGSRCTTPEPSVRLRANVPGGPSSRLSAWRTVPRQSPVVANLKVRTFSCGEDAARCPPGRAFSKELPMGRTSVRAFAIWAVVVAMAACGGTGAGQAGPAGTVQGQQVTRRGVVSSGNAASFMIGSQAVVTSPATQFIDGTAANVVSGAQVEVEGTLDAQGTLQADKVRFEQQQQPE